MPTKYIADMERVIRYVPWAKLRRNEDDTVIYGPMGSAFALREVEDYLSVTWSEFFAGSESESFRCAVEAFRNSDFEVKAKGCFCVAPVGKIKEFMAKERRKIRVVHEPELDNQAHVAVRSWPKDGEEDLLERLAEDVWTETWNKEQVDTLPLGACEISARGMTPA